MTSAVGVYAQAVAPPISAHPVSCNGPAIIESWLRKRRCTAAKPRAQATSKQRFLLYTHTHL